ncbi:MAG: endonuclease/exonuclease/phosphatase family protein [Myxococcota bacterium]
MLKSRIRRAGIPSSRIDESILLATWNVRELGKSPRGKASLHYIAEIVGQFDLVALVEVRDNLADLRETLGYLGPAWDVVYSDFVTDDGGNHERVAHVYDKRAVVFTGLASVAEPRRVKRKNGEYLPTTAWWRRPSMASFRSGSFDFVLLTLHSRWGTTTGRAAELERIAAWVHERRNERHVEDKDIIVLGDFNIPGLRSPLYKAVTRRGLQVPTALLGIRGSNLARDTRHDQTLHDPVFTRSFGARGGVLDFHVGAHRVLYPG